MVSVSAKKAAVSSAQSRDVFLLSACPAIG
jgi:hypothetical protein